MRLLHRNCRFVCVLLVLLSCHGVTLADHPTLSLDKGSAGPITTLSARTLPKGNFALTLQNQWVFSDELSDEELLEHADENEGIHSVERLQSTSLAGVFGVTDKLTVGFSLPYIKRSNLREAHHDHGHDGEDHEDEDPGADSQVERVGDAHGIGDLSVYGQYRFWSDPGSNADAAWILGLKSPTGSTNESGADGARLETEHQPGSGSWDYLAGLAYSTGAGRLSVDMNVLYTFAGEGSQDTRMGDIFYYNLALSWPIGGEGPGDHAHAASEPHEHGHASFELIAELNGDWRENVSIAGVDDGNTGGNVVYGSLGARARWGAGWSASVSAGLPVIEDLDGIQSEPEARFLVGISKGF